MNSKAIRKAAEAYVKASRTDGCEAQLLEAFLIMGFEAGAKHVIEKTKPLTDALEAIEGRSIVHPYWFAEGALREWKANDEES